MPDKSELRQYLLKRRDEIPVEVRRIKDKSIHERISSLEQFKNAAVIFFFASFRSEVNTFPLMKKAIDDGKRAVVPKVDRNNRCLVLFEIKEIEELVSGYMGIPEPLTAANARMVEPNSVDAIIIPGAGFDLRGNRIGYSGGYYDRLLAALSQKPPVIAPAYEEQILEEIPAEPHDIKVDIIVTDRRTIFC